MHRKNLSASYSAQNMMRSNTYHTNEQPITKTMPKPRYESSQSTNDFYAKFFEEDSQRSTCNYSSKERKKRKYKKDKKSKFKKNRRRYNEDDESISESDSLSRESSSDDALIIYAEEDKEEKAKRLHKQKKKNRRARSIETPASHYPNPMYHPNYNGGMGTPMMMGNPMASATPYYGYQTPGYMPMAPMMTPSPMHPGFYNNPYSHPMYHSLMKTRFSNYDDDE